MVRARGTIFVLGWTWHVVIHAIQVYVNSPLEPPGRQIRTSFELHNQIKKHTVKLYQPMPLNFLFEYGKLM